MRAGTVPVEAKLAVVEQAIALAKAHKRAGMPWGHSAETLNLGETLDRGGEPWQWTGQPWREQPAVRHVLPIVERWCKDEIDRLMVLAPTQTLKTTIATAGLAYRTLVYPGKWSGYASFRSDKAVGHSVEARRMFSRAGGRLRSGSARGDKWLTEDGGGIWTGGIGAGAGERTHALVLDDLDKNEKESMGPAYQRAVDTWLDYVIYGRQAKLSLDGATPDPLKLLWIQSRMPFENDSTGRRLLAAAETDEEWTLLVLGGLYDPGVLDVYRAMSPAFTVLEAFRTKPGEPLTGTRQFWLDLRAKNPRVSAGQDDQNPRKAAAGGMFHGWWLPRLPNDPAAADGEAAYRKSCRAYDIAGTEGGGDWTPGVKMGITVAAGRVVLRHGFRAQKSQRGVKRMMAAASLLDGPTVTILIPQDPGAGGKGQLRTYAGYVRRIYALLDLPCPSILGVPPAVIRRGKVANFQDFADRATPASRPDSAAEDAEATETDMVPGMMDLVEAEWVPEIRDVVPALAEAVDFGTVTPRPAAPAPTLRPVAPATAKPRQLSTEDRAELKEIERASRQLVVEGGLRWWKVAGPELERFPKQDPDDYVDAVSHGNWWLHLPTI